MYINSGYLNNSRLPFKDKSKPLIVGSCGTYRLRTKERLPTWRPRGRLDGDRGLCRSGGQRHDARLQGKGSCPFRGQGIRDEGRRRRSLPV